MCYTIVAHEQIFLIKPIRTKKIMKYTRLLTFALCAMVALFSCTEQAETEIPPNGDVVTRTVGGKTPIISAYIEVNDTNPLNVGSYYMGDKPFFDIALIFAANIHVDNNGYPALHFNDHVTAIMADVDQYIRPLQAKGIKVVLSIIGDRKGLGVANLTDSHADKFASILQYTVDHYGLDGIDLDDEYARYGEYGFPAANTTSYGNLINKLRERLGPNKIISVYDWGYSYTIDSIAAANLDYAWSGNMGASSYSKPNISGLPNNKWSAQKLNLRNNYFPIFLHHIKMKSTQAKRDGMGAILTYDIRIASEKDPLPVLKKMAEGAFAQDVTYDGNEYPKNWTPAVDRLTITYDDIICHCGCACLYPCFCECMTN